MNIWVPKCTVLEAELTPSTIKLEGEYTIKKYKADTGQLIQEIGPFKNLITNQGLDRAGATSGTVVESVFVGTGTATPAVTDTVLGNYLAYTSSVQVAWNAATTRGGSPDYWVQGSGTWRFGVGVAAGNLTEVGVGWGNSLATHKVFSRALIVDSGGSPVTLTVLSDEYLDVTYSLRVYPYTGSDVVQSITLSGTSYTFTTRSLDVATNTWSGCNVIAPMRWVYNSTMHNGTAPGTPPTLSAITASYLTDSGSSANISPTTSAYSSGSYTRSVTYNAGLTECNLTYGLRGMIIRMLDGANGSFIGLSAQSVISPAIPKDNTKVMSFGASVTWSRH